MTCSHKFTFFWLRMASAIAEIFHVFMCFCSCVLLSRDLIFLRVFPIYWHVNNQKGICWLCESWIYNVEAVEFCPLGRKYSRVIYCDIVTDSLSRESYVTMITCISPSSRDALQTIMTLRFAEQAKKVMSKPKINQMMQKFRVRITNNKALL